MAITTAIEAANIMNEALKAGGYSYQIDTTDATTIENGFKAVGAFPPSQKNALLEQVNIILVFRNYGTMFDSSKNPTRRFWRDAINYGGGEEDIFQEILEPVQGYWASDFANGDSDGSMALNVAKQLVGYHGGEVKKKFHTDLNRFDLAISVSDHEISKIFTPEGFAGYIDVKIANLQWSAEVQIMNAVINCVKSMVTDEKIKISSGHNLNTENGVTSVVEAIRTATDGMTTLNRLYNYSEVLNISNKDDLFLFVTPKFMNRIRVRGAANAYNMNEYFIQNNVVTLPAGTDFGTDEDGLPIHAILVDRRAIVMAFRYWAMKPFVPSNTDYINYFLKIEYLRGYNEFFNAYAFSGEEIDENFIEPSNEGATLIVDTSTSGAPVEISPTIYSRRVDTGTARIYYGVKKMVVEVRTGGGAVPADSFKIGNDQVFADGTFDFIGAGNQLEITPVNGAIYVYNP